jgi:hypothetical protein
MQLKAFSSDSVYDLSESVNDWILKNANHIVIFDRVSHVSGAAIGGAGEGYTIERIHPKCFVLIWYREIPKQS